MAPNPFYITTPIYYVNGKPHIGHVFTTLLADTLRRFKDLQGYDTYFTTGTDEHGQKVQQTAEKLGVTPQEWCDGMAKTFETYFLHNFELKPSVFMRTTMPEHVETATMLWKKLHAAGLIYKDNYEGWYCVADEAFVTETNLRDAIDENGKPCKVSVDSNQPCTFLSETNYKFRLSAFQEPLLKFYSENPDIIVPTFRQAEIVSFIQSGLRDLSISRSRDKISWGIPVPGDEEHIMYVWIDALTIYLTGGQSRISLTKPFESKYWPANVQFLGKDIARFHCVYWPAFLMGAGIPLPRKFFIHGWWTINEQKIGKSLGNAVDPMALVETYGLDPVKYFMLREGSPSNDPSLSEELIQMRLDSDLANVLGNLVMRCTAESLLPDRIWPNPAKVFTNVTFATLRTTWRDSRKSSLDEYVKLAANGDSISELLKLDEVSELIDKGLLIFAEVVDFMENIDIPGALVKIFSILTGVNNYIQITAPWALIKKVETKPAYEFVLYCAMELLRICATLLLPFLPQKAPLILDQLGVSKDARLLKKDLLTFGYTEPGQVLGERLPPLFPKVVSKKFEAAEKAPQQKPDKQGKKQKAAKKVKEAVVEDK